MVLPHGRTRNHGFYALRDRLKARGLHAIDGRSAAAIALKEWRCQFIEDLGGEANVSAAKLSLIDLACRQRLLLEHLDAWLLAQPSLINKRKKVLIPIVAQRQQLSESLTALLVRLGLERIPKPAKSLAEYLAEKEAACATSSKP